MNGIVSGTAGPMNIWLWSHFAFFVEEAFIFGTTAVLCWQSLSSLSLEERSDFQAWVKMCRCCSMLKNTAWEVLHCWDGWMDFCPTVATLLKLQCHSKKKMIFYQSCEFAVCNKMIIWTIKLAIMLSLLAACKNRQAVQMFLFDKWINYYFESVLLMNAVKPTYKLWVWLVSIAQFETSCTHLKRLSN